MPILPSHAMLELTRLRGWIGLAAAALSVCVGLLAPWQWPSEPELSMQLAGEVRDATAERAGSISQRPFQSLRSRDGLVQAEYGFVNFNDDPLRVGLTIATAQLASYQRDYGYTQQELKELTAWQKQALEGVYKTAVEQELDQATYDRLANEVKAEYRRRHRSLLQERGFKFVGSNTIAVDIPLLVRRNVKEVHAVAVALAQAGRVLNYGSDELLGACLAMLQTAFHYDQVPAESDGRVSGGVTPPLTLLAEGRGDCDSKSALLAALLLNWDTVRLVGVGVPNHYLLGILRNPAKGEAFVEYEGLRYVLIEPAGPGWLPLGAIAPTTLDLLASGSGVSIEPLLAN